MLSRVARTRAALQAAALELFAAQGYDQTTVAQIAAAAGVSHMTFFRHFPTKESVLLDDPYDPVIGELVAAQPADLPALRRVARGLLTAWGHVEGPTDAATLLRVRLVAGHPVLRAAAVRNNQRTEAAIVEALTATGATRWEAVAAAGACLGALTATLFAWGETDEDGSLGMDGAAADADGDGSGPGPLGERIVTTLEQLAGKSVSGEETALRQGWLGKQVALCRDEREEKT